ncbi:MAG: SDR family oxidoreductase [Deltaproteobacteria bacterium]|jgi:NAD(P)-dependent dehydrogenase (short-subunit alcohol dehydrogenase family)|nr:SDR family oxidoreductase [Deltaproteobacteria bacterium]MBW2498127.1 SDR family oxidoreductase [Deltaproteobacteria bacterium]
MEDLLGLSGRTAFVVGAGRGAGRGIAIELARAGMHVAAVDLDANGSAETVRKIEALGARGLALTANATVADELESALAMATEAFGPLRVGVNNIGNFGHHPSSSVLEHDWDFWQTAIDRNLRTTFVGARAMARSMIRKGTPGAIVNIASLSGLRGSPNLAPYGAAKAGVMQFTQSLALELAPHGIRVNCVAPTAIDGPTLRESLSPEAIAARAASMPLGRIAQPEDVGRTVLMLASDLAGFVTGQTVMCDGGVSCTTQRPTVASGEARPR